MFKKEEQLTKHVPMHDTNNFYYKVFIKSNGSANFKMITRLLYVTINDDH